MVVMLAACGRAPEPPRDAAPVAAPTPVPTPASVPAPVTSYVVPAQSGEVLGHLRVAEPYALLAKLGDAVIPDVAMAAWSVDGIRSALGDGTSVQRRAVAEHLDFGRPVGCVLLDPVARQVPIACAFGYRGGLAQLEADLATTATREGDGLQTRIGEVPVRLEASGDDVIVGADADAIANARAYLQALTIVGGDRDVELVLHAAHAVRTHRVQASDMLRTLMELWARAGVLQTTRLDVADLDEMTLALAMVALDELLALCRQIDRADLYATLGPEGLVLGLHAVPSAGSALRTVTERAPAIDGDALDWLPAGTWLAIASRRDQDDVLTEAWPALVARLLARPIARFTGRSLQDVAAAWAALRDEQAQVYGDWLVAAAFHSPAARAGAMLVRPKIAGNARDRWLERARAATPETVLGAELGGQVQAWVRWSVTPDAETIDGVSLDAWRLHAAPEILDALGERFAAGELGAEIVAALRGGTPMVSVLRFELDGAVAFVAAPGSGIDHATKVIHARRGTGRLRRDGIDAIARRHAELRTVAALSAFDLVRALHEMLPDDLLTGVPDTVGRDLSDAFAAEYVTGDGAFAAEVVVSGFVLDAARKLLDRASEPP